MFLQQLNWIAQDLFATTATGLLISKTTLFTVGCTGQTTGSSLMLTHHKVVQEMLAPHKYLQDALTQHIDLTQHKEIHPSA